jgi:hypothetical protein
VTGVAQPLLAFFLPTASQIRSWERRGGGGQHGTTRHGSGGDVEEGGGGARGAAAALSDGLASMVILLEVSLVLQVKATSSNPAN